MEIKEHKKQAIADAAKELFSKYGYKTVSMDKIAVKSEVAKGTLYLYFKDKEELFLYLFTEIIDEIKTIMDEIKSRNLSLSDEIAEFVYHLLLYRKNQEFFFRIFNEANELKTQMARNGVKMIDNLIEGYLKDRLSSVIDPEKINIEVLVFVIIRTYSALAFEWEETHEPLNERQIADTISFLLQGSVCKSEQNERCHR
jgi:AcrR family transcriptional regulator